MGQMGYDDTSKTGGSTPDAGTTPPVETPAAEEPKGPAVKLMIPAKVVEGGVEIEVTKGLFALLVSVLSDALSQIIQVREAPVPDENPQPNAGGGEPEGG